MAGLESRGGGAGSLLTPLPLGTSCSQRNFLVKHLLHSPHVTALPPLMISYVGSFPTQLCGVLKSWKKQMPPLAATPLPTPQMGA